MCPSCSASQRSQGGAMRWFVRSAGKWLLAGVVVGASALSASSLRAQQPEILPAPVTVRVPSAGTSLFPGIPALQQPMPMTDAEGNVPGEALPDGALPEGAVPDGDDPPGGGGGMKGGDGKAGQPFWARCPPVEKCPRPGWFPVLPNGPGYYSLHDVLTGNYRKGPPKYPYPRFLVIPFSMFNLDWRYLDDPKNEEHDIFDFLKRIHLVDDFMFTTGGEFRFR